MTPDPSLPAGVSPPSTFTWADVFGPGLEAVRALWRPFVAIQLCALALVIAYFTLPSVREACDAVGRLKERGGVLAAAAVMAVACGVVPEIFKFLTGVDRSFTAARARSAGFHIALFAVGGACVYLFYEGLNHLFAGTASMVAIPSKVLIDQLLYTPTLGLGVIAVGYTLREQGWSPARTLRAMTGAWYLRRVVTLLPPCWAYWFPMTTLMYSLPGSLTFPFGVLAGAASAIVLTAVAARTGRR